MLKTSASQQTTLRARVLVRFATDKPGVFVEGDFIGVFKRITQDRVQEMLDDEWRNSEVLDEVLVGAEEIGDENGEPLPSDKAVAWVKQQPECVNAAVVAFFQSMAPANRNGKTSRKRR